MWSTFIMAEKLNEAETFEEALDRARAGLVGGAAISAIITTYEEFGLLKQVP
jgi:hypothetical protein